jgi:hypothetical protein
MENFPYCNFFGTYTKIYTLSDENGNVFYVGSTTTRLEIRLANHITVAKKNKSSGNKRKDAHIRKLNYKITATIVDMIWVTADRKKDLTHKADKIEKQWIDKYLSLGYALLNGRQVVPKKVIDPEPEYIGKTINVSSDAISPDKPKIRIVFKDRPETATAK